jgi:hypothetical protein
MSAEVTLRTPLEYDRPRFHPGQVLPDTELTRLAESGGSRLGAETGRHGWGVVRGLIPRVSRNGRKIELSAGMAVDEKGQLFIIDTAQQINLSELLESIETAGIWDSGTLQEYDLWLSIRSEELGNPLAHQTLAGAAAYAPVREDRRAPADSRTPREAVVAKVWLRPTDVFDGLIGRRTEAFSAFAKEFDKAAPGEKFADIQSRRLALLADLLAKPAESYGGVPLGRVGLLVKQAEIKIDKIDLARGRRSDARDELFAPPGHINVAPVLDMPQHEAVTWLAKRGIKPWTARNIRKDAGAAALQWHLALRPVETARLYMHDGRVAAVRSGPVIEEAVARLLQVLTVLIVLLMLITLALLARAIQRGESAVNNAEHRTPPIAVVRLAEIPFRKGG